MVTLSRFMIMGLAQTVFNAIKKQNHKINYYPPFVEVNNAHHVIA